jgi:penicillin-binding protein 1C
VMPASPGLAPHLARRLFSQFPHETSLTSTIDLDLQAKVTAIMKKNLYRLSEQNVHDSAAIVIDNQNGRVLAYVGTLSTSESPHVDGVEAYRQAGSSLKPFIYAKAIESKTLTAASILLDDPTAISWGGQVYRPANYDQHFNGPVSAREALASSLNVPAVKTVTIIGLRQTYQVLQSIMLTNLKDPDFYGVSMALGAVEVRLDELANAYRMLANGGLWSPLHFVDSKTEKTLQALHAPESHRVFSPESAFIISSILSDPNARSIGFGWENPLETPFWTAVKTGTSKDYRDNWCAGFSERYTVAVWAGNFDAQAMHKVSGVSGVGPTWFEIMNVLHAQIRSAAPKMPSGLVAKNVRHQWSSHEHLEYFIKGSEPAQSVIEPSLDKRVQFVFPAEGSVLVKDPHLDASRIALFIRFAGQVPAGSRLVWDGKDVGEALSPFKMEAPAAGEHDLAIVAPTAANHSKDAAAGSSTNVTHVHFTIRGAE